MLYNILSYTDAHYLQLPSYVDYAAQQIILHIVIVLDKLSYSASHYSHSYLEVIEWFFSYSPSYLTLECNISPRPPPENNIGKSEKREDQYCLRAAALTNIALMSQT